MPGRKIFAPTTRQQDERLIYRKQENFYDGVYNDIPASTLSDRALFFLKNFVNFGKFLIGRAGSKRVSNTRFPAIENRGPYSATKSGSIVTLSTGDITSDDIGLFVWWSDTKTYERINSVTSTKIFTVQTSTAHSAVTDMTLAGAYNQGYYHKGKDKVIHHIDEKLYSSDVDVSSYTKCVRSGNYTPDIYKTVMGELNNFVFLWSNRAIFKIDLEYSTPTYFPINRGLPEVAITDSGSDTSSTPYMYRYNYTLLRLSGDGPRDRNTEEVHIEVESGSVKFDKINKDYGETWLADELSSSYNNTIGTMAIPKDPITDKYQAHFTHYAIYRTLNLGVNGKNPVTGYGNNSELYVWVADIPIGKAFTASQAGLAITSTIGVFTDADVGSTLTYANGFSTVIYSVSSAYSAIAATYGNVSSQSAAIGGGDIITVSQATTTVTKTTGRDFTAADVGKFIFYADGKKVIITDFLTAATVTVNISQTVASQGATIDPQSRKYNDIMSDDDLRIQAGAWTLFGRFYEPVPQTNTGVIVPGFMFAAQRYGNYCYYCELPQDFEYMAGYHYPLQYLYLKDIIESLRDFPDKCIAYCKTSTYSIPLNTFETKEIPGTGAAYTVLPNQALVDSDIGCLDYGSIQSFADGKDILVNNDFGIRIFDGTKFSDNIIYNRIMKRIMKCQTAFASSYDEENGYMLYGRRPT